MAHAFAWLALAFCAVAQPAAAQKQKPSLVVLIVVDQLGSDYLLRWSPQLTGGLQALAKRGG